MKLLKPKFWNSKFNFFTIILLPISLLMLLIIKIKKILIKSKIFNIPIICVGNIYVGGTGKTPLSIYIAKELREIGFKSAIVKKFYDQHKDEHDLIKNYFDNLILHKDRQKAINIAIKNNFNLVILDDGFQDYKIKKNLNIICFNNPQLVGNGFLIPAGPLRESLDSLINAQIVIINGEKNINFEKKLILHNNSLKIFYSEYKPLNIEKFKNSKLLAFAGIGSPENFFKLLQDNKLNVAKKIKFPDHYKFDDKHISQIKLDAKKNNYKIVTTEKDYLRIKELDSSGIEFVKVELVIHQKEKFIKEVCKLKDETN